MTQLLPNASENSDRAPPAPAAEVEHICERHPPESQIRQTLSRAGILTVRLIGPPGSGKTELIRGLLSRISMPHRVAVIVVNPAAERDAAKLCETCVHVQSINAPVPRTAQVWQAVQKLPLKEIDLIFIETCGGLAALEDLGQDTTVVTLALTGGDDKAQEYSALMKVASAVVLTNIDLRQMVKFDERAFRRDVQSVNASAEIFEVSSTTGSGIFPFLVWLEEKRDMMKLRKARIAGAVPSNENFIG